LQWFVEKTTIALGRASPPGKLEEAEALEVAARRLSQLAREKLGELCPAFGPVLDPVAALKAAATPPEQAPSAPQAPTSSPEQASPHPDAPASAAPPPAAGADPGEFLGNVGSSLVDVAAALRQADASDPQAYRILRVGLWLHMPAAPPATGGRTQIPAPPEGLRAKLATIAQNQVWPALLEETEAATSQHRFWLDLHRMSFEALSALGPTRERARDAVVAELRSLLARMPQLPTLSFGDGTPLADPQTRAWIEEQVLASTDAAPGRRAGVTDDDGAAEKLAGAKKLLSARQVPEALALLRDEAARRNGRRRFLLTTEAARLCASAGLTAIAKSLYEELDREGRAHRLEEWEPELAAECLKGLLASARALAKDPRGSLPDLTEPYRRLCRIDPAAANEVWP